MSTASKVRGSVIAGSDPTSQLYRAIERYVKANSGTVIVIGGVQVQEWSEDLAYSYRIAVKCTGQKPTFSVKKERPTK